MAATESNIQYSPGSGGNLHGIDRSIGSTTKADQVVQRGLGYLATHTAIARGVRVNIANSHLLIIQGDGTNYVRLHRLLVRQANLAAAASTLDIRVLRTTTAGTGGTTINARALDAADTTPYAGVVASLPTAKGNETDELLSFRLGTAAANPITAVNREEWRADASSGVKPPIVGNATANGLCVKNIGSGAFEVDIEAEVSIADYL